MIIRTRIIALALSSVLIWIDEAGFCQRVGMNTSGTAPANSAMLDVASSTNGILIPRVVLTDVAVYAPLTGTPVTSLLVFNTSATTNNGNGVGYYYWGGSNWVYLIAPASGPGTTGQVLTSTGSGNPTWNPLPLSGASCVPTMISPQLTGSKLSPGTTAVACAGAKFTAMDCATACWNLTYNGYTGWYLPTDKEYMQLFSLQTNTGNCYSWTSSVYPFISGDWIGLNENTGAWDVPAYNSLTQYCRCVR